MRSTRLDSSKVWPPDWNAIGVSPTKRCPNKQIIIVFPSVVMFPWLVIVPSAKGSPNEGTQRETVTDIKAVSPTQSTTASRMRNATLGNKTASTVSPSNKETSLQRNNEQKIKEKHASSSGRLIERSHF